jgi:transformation/transcription domain-associated protein
VSFEHGDGEKLIGSPPAPDAENSENVISTFILELIEPDNPFGTSDAVRILLLQLSCLLVDQGDRLASFGGDGHSGHFYAKVRRR